MAASSKTRLRRFSSQRSKYLLRRGLKALIVMLVVVLLFKWSERSLAFTLSARESDGHHARHETQGIRVVEVSPIEADDDASLYYENPVLPEREAAHQKVDSNRGTIETEALQVLDNVQNLTVNTRQLADVSKTKVQATEKNIQPLGKKNNGWLQFTKPSNKTPGEKKEPDLTNVDATMIREKKSTKEDKAPLLNISLTHATGGPIIKVNKPRNDDSIGLKDKYSETVAPENTIERLKDVIGGMKTKLEDMRSASDLPRRHELHPTSISRSSAPASSLVETGDPRPQHAEDGSEPNERQGTEHFPAWLQEQQSLKSPGSEQNVTSIWGWECVEERCVRRERSSRTALSDLDTCRLTCGPQRALWPIPSGDIRIGTETASFLFEKIVLKEVKSPSEEVRELVHKAFKIFKNTLQQQQSRSEATREHPKEVVEREVLVQITVSGSATRLALEISEEYTLDIRSREANVYVNIFAPSFFGARHGLETLSQLIVHDDGDELMKVVSFVALMDAPAFKYRGVLLDTSRNFFSVASIERTLDAMAANKLNTFHWHITDSHSFPLFLETLPKMAYYGAYSSRQVYLPTDVRHLVEYGRVRGIRVLPEFDAPAHVGNGWQWAEKEGLGKLAVCVDQEPWTSYCKDPPCGQLNIVNKNTYVILGQIYREMVQIFGPLDFFHFGGHEVSLGCWNSTEDVVSYMKSHSKSLDADAFYKLWSEFQAKAEKLLGAANDGNQILGFLWTSELTAESRAAKYLDPRRYIIQIEPTATDAMIRGLLDNGFRVVFSEENKSWQQVYSKSLHDIAMDLTGKTQDDLILGGETVVWSGQVDEGTLDSMLWPRGAALAERLWANPGHDWSLSAERLLHQRRRLASRGIMADPMQSEWCLQNEGRCYSDARQ